jgi:succinate dehydrogenase / fumarate reductase cytochrome b subunit
LTSLTLTITETLRYRGAIGQWSWVLHRLSGLGVILFLILHVVDTSWAVFYPGEYIRAIAEYQTPLFTLGEFALVAAVVYHAFNGLRIIFFDYKPERWRYQEIAAWGVLAATAIVLVPVFLLMFGHVNEFYFGDEPGNVLSLGEVLGGQIRFVVGMGVALIVALVLSALYGAIRGEREEKAGPSRFEGFWWSFMRISGILIVPLVFGHLVLMHVLQGVFDIQFNAALAEHAAVGAVGMGANATGTAVEFVADRWNTLVAGVAIWRLYDGALLALVVTHGFNGLRYVFTDYARNETVKRGLVYLCFIAGLVLLVLGAGALLISVDDTAIQLAQEAFQHLYE